MVFADASSGDSENPSYVQLIGPWAVGAWYQSLLLFTVVVFTLGKRFGLAAPDRTPEPSQRDLADALADTYARGRAGQIALNVIAADADVRVKSILRLPRSASMEDRNRRLPWPLAHALTVAETKRDGPIDEFEIMTAAIELDRQLAEFADATRSSRARNRPKL